MILKEPLPEDPTPIEAPPSYETVTNLQHTTGPNLKLTSPLAGSSSPLYNSRASPIYNNASPTTPKPPNSAQGKGKGRAGNPWSFGFLAARSTSKDAKATILGLVNDLVWEDYDSVAAVGILQSCSEACSASGLILSSLLQEKSIEDHTPLYWAIVKRHPDEMQDDATRVPDLLSALLSYSAPLLPQTILDVRHACLLTSDQSLFQRLKLNPDFSSSSTAERMLMGVTLPPDEVRVQNLSPDDGGSFTVDIEILKFQKRMMITKSISIEFIARNRLWCLRFFIAPDTSDRPGSWCLSLSLMEHSSPTWIDSRLLIPDPDKTGTTNTKSKPTISLRLKSSQPLAVPSGKRNGSYVTEILVAFEDSLMATTLQYSGSSYVTADETLKARFEAKLSKPGNECIIC